MNNNYSSINVNTMTYREMVLDPRKRCRNPKSSGVEITKTPCDLEEARRSLGLTKYTTGTVVSR